VPRLIFYRSPGRWYQQRPYAVVSGRRAVDRQLLGWLRRDGELVVTLPPGQYDLRAVVAGTGSRWVTVDLAADAPDIRIGVRYAGRVPLLGATWRAFTFTRWLDLVVDPPG
jgi:hypothetical protein